MEHILVLLNLLATVILDSERFKLGFKINYSY